MDFENRYNLTNLTSGKQLQALKDHINEYFIIGDTAEGVIDLKLDIVGDESLTADCDVTDHYVETNTARQDQISLKPKEYSISGEVGELVWYQKDSASQIVGQVAQKLEGIISLLPVRSKSFNQMKSKAMKAAQWVDTASNAVSQLSNLYNKVIGYDEDNKEITRSITHQMQAYQKLTDYRDNRKVVSIETPWGILENYVITSLKFSQSRSTRDKSQISITFKEFRTVSIGNYVKFDPNKYQGDAAFENQPKIDNGTTSGTDVGTSKQETDAEGNIFYTDTVTVGEKEYDYKFYPEDGFAAPFNKDGSAIDDNEYDDVLKAMNMKIGENIQEGVFKL